MKKILSAVLSLALALAFSGLLGASAIGERGPTLSEDITDYEEEYYKHPETALSLEEFVGAARYAYMSLVAAPKDLAGKIIEERNRIIFSESWAYKAGTAWVLAADGVTVLSELPAFYSKFPADWDFPRDEQYVAAEVAEFADAGANFLSAATAAAWNNMFAGSVALPAASSATAPDFFGFDLALPRNVRTRATSIPGSSINIGYSLNGVSFYYKTYMTQGEYLTTLCSGASNHHYSVRCSTYSTTGSANMEVDWESY